MSFNIVVLAKQVPDTRNVGKDAMTPQGTVNRAALPAIFNPEDLNALEQALRIKDLYPDSRITIITMALMLGYLSLIVRWLVLTLWLHPMFSHRPFTKWAT